MKKILGIFLICISGSVNAALIDYTTYTTDTASGLDWLDLSATNGMTMVAAQSANSSWRFATNGEVENLFGQLFEGYYDTEIFGASYNNNGGYADQDSDVVAFNALFGPTASSGSFIWNYGIYKDEDSIVRFMGTRITSASDNYVYGLEATNDYSSHFDTESQEAIGTYLVRTSVVPVPAAVWLFGSALGLVGFLRRRAA